MKQLSLERDSGRRGRTIRWTGARAVRSLTDNLLSRLGAARRARSTQTFDRFAEIKDAKFCAMLLSPTQLAEIDTVDVANLEGVHADRVSEFMQNAGDAPHIPIADELAQRIADLWRTLPAGEQARCHVPPFGLRFYLGGELQLQASICWACNNIFGEVKGDSFWYAFDAQHETSQKLLALCKQVFESG